MKQQRLKRVGSGKSSELIRAHKYYEQRAWRAAYEAFLLADQDAALGANDLELLATAACLLGRDEEYLKTLERAFNVHRETRQRVGAAQCAFWVGFRLLMRGEMGRATGWLARAQRLLERVTSECAVRGYLLLPTVEQQMESDDFESAFATATSIVEIGERCEDSDLIACARHQQGRIRIKQGKVEAGLALLDETMVAVSIGELSPIVTGLLYCSVIGACQQVFALDRTREWTAALKQWCDGQEDLVAFTGACQVHRAEIMQLQGRWLEAVEEARSAHDRSQGINQKAAAEALYQQAEIYRLRGEFGAAEEAFIGASDLGLEPQPGLALLRLAQGNFDAASTAIRRVAGTTTDRLKRMGLLPAYTEIMLAIGDVEDARRACQELETIARSFDTGVPGAIAAEARGALELAEDDAQNALSELRQAFEVWQRIEAPYAAARVRVLIGRACRSLGDEEGARLELAAARSTFEGLGAMPDLARIDSLTSEASREDAHPLTPRELQVLRLVSVGKTNASIAAELFLSERTVERHLSNILTKLDVPTRTAATAWAYQHDLI
jgi:DNA-binding CsgD family transcriptional regulator